MKWDQELKCHHLLAMPVTLLQSKNAFLCNLSVCFHTGIIEFGLVKLWAQVLFFWASVNTAAK